MYARAIPANSPRSVRRPRAQWPIRVRNSGLLAVATLFLLVGFARVVEGAAPSNYETVFVQPGDTLWTIAGDRYPGTDVRNKVIQIEQANHLNHRPIHAGDALRVPSR